MVGWKRLPSAIGTEIYEAIAMALGEQGYARKVKNSRKGWVVENTDETQQNIAVIWTAKVTIEKGRFDFNPNKLSDLKWKLLERFSTFTLRVQHIKSRRSYDIF